jgi:mono/diheme cytochrome c family protein
MSLGSYDRREQEERSHPDVLALHQAAIREIDDPRDGFAPTPVWLLFFFFGLAAWGGAYLVTHNGGCRADVYDDKPAAAGPQAAPVEEKFDAMAVGSRTFNTCAQCHQSDAKGVPGTYPPLAGSEWVQGRKEVLVRILLHGLEGDVHVAGGSYNGQMPSWSKLNDRQIAGLATYIRGSFGNSASAVSPGEVVAIRQATKDHSQSWNENELKQVLSGLGPEQHDAPALATHPPAVTASK